MWRGNFVNTVIENVTIVGGRGMSNDSDEGRAGMVNGAICDPTGAVVPLCGHVKSWTRAAWPLAIANNYSDWS